MSATPPPPNQPPTPQWPAPPPTGGAPPPPPSGPPPSVSGAQPADSATAPPPAGTAPVPPPPSGPPLPGPPPQGVGGPSAAFDPGGLVPTRKAGPSSGLRRVLFRLSAGRLNLGPSAADAARTALVGRARTPAARGRRRIAMISLKGGVGKTTTTVMLGHTLARVRGDNVIAVDANPDAGNLASRIPRETPASARDLLRHGDELVRYAEVRRFTSQASSRLEVLAGERDPALSEAFGANEYEAVLAALERFYSIILTDCGTGILHDAMRAVLWYADQLVVVTSPAVDSAQALGQLLDWLDQHGYHHLVASAVVVVNGVHRRNRVRLETFTGLFGGRTRAVAFIPYDAALAPGGEADLEALAPSTRRAYLELAATVGDGFAIPPVHHDDPRPAGIQSAP